MMPWWFGKLSGYIRLPCKRVVFWGKGEYRPFWTDTFPARYLTDEEMGVHFPHQRSLK